MNPEPELPVTGTSRRTLLMAFRSAAGGAVVSYVANVALLPFVIHRLGPELYGAWVTIAAVLVVGGLADAGVRVEIVRRVGAAHGAGESAQLVRSVHEGLTLLLVVAGLFLAVGFLGAPVFRAFAFPHGVAALSAGSVDWLVRSTCALLALSLIGNGYCGALKGLQRSDVEMVALAAAVPVGAIITVIAIYLEWGIWAMLVGASAQQCISLGWQYICVRRLLPELRLGLARMTRGAAVSFLALSGFVLIGQLSDVVDSQWDKVVLSRYVGSAGVASFQIGTSLVMAGKALVVVPIAPLLVTVAEFRDRDERKMEMYSTVLAKAGMVIAAVVLGGIFVFAPPFIRLWLGDDVSAAGEAARLFSAASLFGMFGAPMAYRAIGEGWHTVVASGALVNMVINGGFSLLFTIWFGFNGPLYGSILGNLAGTSVLLFLVRRRLGERWRRPPLGAVGVGVGAAGLFVILGGDRVTTWPAVCLLAMGWTVAVGAAATAIERLPVRTLLRRGLSV